MRPGCSSIACVLASNTESSVPPSGSLWVAILLCEVEVNLALAGPCIFLLLLTGRRFWFWSNFSSHSPHRAHSAGVSAASSASASKKLSALHTLTKTKMELHDEKNTLDRENAVLMEELRKVEDGLK